jgi:hypothetical protein
VTRSTRFRVGTQGGGRRDYAVMWCKCRQAKVAGKVAIVASAAAASVMVGRAAVRAARRRREKKA